MKKLILIFSLAVCFLTANCQFQKSFDMSEISGTDTTFFYSWYTQFPWELQVDYSTLDADDATIDIGSSMDGTLYTSYDLTDMPYILNTAVKTSLTVFSREGFSATNLGIKITKGTVTTGVLTIKGRNK